MSFASFSIEKIERHTVAGPVGPPKRQRRKEAFQPANRLCIGYVRGRSVSVGESGTACVREKHGRRAKAVP